jgi:methylmalonyl-CoA/ethylmalonyl-CoA epimerase
LDRKAVFSGIRQIGLVVRSVEATARRCQEELGIGPWTFYTFDPSNVANMRVHGRRVDHAMRTAHAKFGDIDWEIIEPLDERSIYAEHLRTRGEGLHHILFSVDDYEGARARLRERGYAELAGGDWSGGAYSYFDTTSALACVAEIFRPNR